MHSGASTTEILAKKQLFRNSSRIVFIARVSLVLALSTLLPALNAPAGTWTALNHPPPQGVEFGLLLSDGTVMCLSGYGGTNWFRLIPDSHGSYVNGTWQELAPMNYSRLYF